MNQCMTDTKHTVAEQYSLAKTYCKQTFGSEKKSEESKEFQCMVLEFKALKHDIAKSYSKAKKLGKTQQTMVASWHDFALAFARMGTHNKVMQQKIDSISTTTDHGEKDQQLYGLAATTAADDDEEEEEDDDGARERKGREGTRRAKEKDSSERVMQAFVPFSNELNDHAQAHIDEFRTLIIRPLGALHTVDVPEFSKKLTRLSSLRLKYDAAQHRDSNTPSSHDEKQYIHSLYLEAKDKYEHLQSLLASMFDVIDLKKKQILSDNLNSYIGSQQTFFDRSAACVRNKIEELGTKKGKSKKASSQQDEYARSLSSSSSSAAASSTSSSSAASPASPISPASGASLSSVDLSSPPLPTSASATASGETNQKITHRYIDSDLRDHALESDMFRED